MVSKFAVYEFNIALNIETLRIQSFRVRAFEILHESAVLKSLVDMEQSLIFVLVGPVRKQMPFQQEVTYLGRQDTLFHQVVHNRPFVSLNVNFQHIKRSLETQRNNCLMSSWLF